MSEGLSFQEQNYAGWQNPKRAVESQVPGPAASPAQSQELLDEQAWERQMAARLNAENNAVRLQRFKEQQDELAWERQQTDQLRAENNATRLQRFLQERQSGRQVTAEPGEAASPETSDNQMNTPEQGRLMERFQPGVMVELTGNGQIPSGQLQGEITLGSPLQINREGTPLEQGGWIRTSRIVDIQPSGNDTLVLHTRSGSEYRVRLLSSGSQSESQDINNRGVDNRPEVAAPTKPEVVRQAQEAPRQSQFEAPRQAPETISAEDRLTNGFSDLYQEYGRIREQSLQGSLTPQQYQSELNHLINLTQELREEISQYRQQYTWNRSYDQRYLDVDSLDDEVKQIRDNAYQTLDRFNQLFVND